MTWNALVPPRRDTEDSTGRCLPFAQSFFGAPIRYDSAWDSWNATQFKHGPEVPLPDVPVLLWYSHYGTYYSYSKGYSFYGNWGHVTPYVPGDAIYSSPAYGFGQDRYATIAEVERAFNAKYVGWSEDINGLRVAEFVPPEPEIQYEEEEIMSVFFEAISNSSPVKQGDPGSSRIWAGNGRVINGSKYSGVWERSEDGSVRRLFEGEWAGIRAAFEAAGRKIPLAKVHGNVIEQMYLAPRSQPKK